MPRYLTVLYPVLSSVWDYVPTRLSFARFGQGSAIVGFGQDDDDRVDRVHAIINGARAENIE